MSHTKTIKPPTVNPPASESFTGIDSAFRLIVIAIERNKQLLLGSPSRLEPDSHNHKSISIALEEVKQGLVPFTIGESEPAPTVSHERVLAFSE